MSILLRLAVSLALTLAVELTLALIWGARGRDIGLVALANLLTNPAVVLIHTLAAQYFAGFEPVAAALLELAAAATEGHIYKTRSNIKNPWIFALCTNALSFALGLALR